MTTMWNLLLLWACLPAGLVVTANTAEDFTNNIISDLGPLLSLFGERVTNQFMTGSMGWADNIILAMAPLGIITIIVASIRVAGPLWMKSIIGRGREPLAGAEMELMSSTSSDVSELWNGQGLVRVAGKGPVHQFIIMPSSSPANTNVVGSVLKYRAPPEASSKSFIGSFLATLSPNRHEAKVINLNNTAHCKPPLKLEESSGKPSESVILLEDSDAAPNIDLNIYGARRYELKVLAAFGTMLQLAVLAFCGWAAYWPHEPGSLLLKDDEQIDRYAFPCTLIGTVLLVVGLILCSHVVESSTRETVFNATDKTSARLLWIQRSSTVNDQTFGSYALYVDKNPFFLTTSRRANTGSTDKKADQGRPTNGGLEAFRQTETTIGVSIGLLGFIAQFIGLRGMGWSAALAQLLATLAMTAIRAWARRESTISFHAIPLDPGFELDWVATHLGPCGELEKVLAVGDGSSTSSANEEKGPELPIQPNFQGLFQTRASFAKLAGLPSSWPRVGAAEAISLTRAIEKTLDLLLKDKEEFIWQHHAFNAGTIEMQVQKRQGKWDATQLTYSLEAALSLWLFSVSSRTSNTPCSDLSDSKTGDDDDRSLTTHSSLILFDSWSKGLVKDLYYWIPPYLASSVVVAERLESSSQGSPTDSTVLDTSDDESTANSLPSGRRRIDKHHVVGFGSSTSSSDYAVERLWSFKQPGKSMVIAAEVTTSLTSLYTQHIYAVFLQELFKVIPKLPNDQLSWWENKANTSQLTGTLSNNTITELVQYLQDIQLFTPGESYFAIIPALSRSKKLAEPEMSLRDVLRESNHNRRLDEVIIRLLTRMENEFMHFEYAPVYVRGALTRRICALLWSCVNLIPNKYFADFYGNEGNFFQYPRFRQLRQFRLPYSKEVARAVENWSYQMSKRYLIDWVLSYDWQSRFDQSHFIRDWPLFTNVKGKDNYHRRMLQRCEHSRLHEAFINGSQEEIDAARAAGDNISERDIWGWTVLHYTAALMSSDSDARFLAALNIMENDPSLVTAPDMMGWTPLHYAAKNPDSGPLLDHILRNSKSDDYNIQLTMELSTPLHGAAEAGLASHIERLKGFGNEKKWFDQADHIGFTPLHGAIVEGHVEASRAILAIVQEHWKAEDYKRRLQLRLTYFHFAVWSGRKEILELFPPDNSELMGDMSTWSDANGLTPIHMAVAGDKTDLVQALLERYKGNLAELSRQDEAGYTPLDIARQQGSNEICTLLESAGAKTGKPKPDMYISDQGDLGMRIPRYISV
ncbi:hypothetical protein QBC40DRAFT_340172 [Triangularia verruculosa]|uniref:Ankyrin repeat protein n=1 Tax=Triangularia verruculosa TaxID=2587418 RepID=A0AAN7ASZ5_9PEZI|nr:hypothetical protein QBC40DRAFT_340172 [Triangularia verruculosa]